MVSSVDIANFALSHLGGGRITSFNDPKEEAIVANLFYNHIRMECLSAYPWSFARKRASLASSATPPAFGYDNAYPLPADYLSLVQAGLYFPNHNYDTVVARENKAYVIEAGQILTDLDAPLEIRYIYDRTDTEGFSAAFAAYVEYKLASAMCMKISQSRTLKDSLEKMSMQRLKQAIAFDRIQSPPELPQSTSWDDARINYYGSV